LSKRYELTGAFAAAVGDYLKAPVVSAINTSKYTGKVNDVIAISADDNHKITAMQVTIVLPNGTALETGAATFLLGDIDWTYKAKSANTTARRYYNQGCCYG
jgi:hypothetical protein